MRDTNGEIGKASTNIFYRKYGSSSSNFDHRTPEPEP